MNCLNLKLFAGWVGTYPALGQWRKEKGTCAGLWSAERGKRRAELCETQQIWSSNVDILCCSLSQERKALKLHLWDKGFWRLLSALPKVACLPESFLMNAPTCDWLICGQGSVSLRFLRFWSEVNLVNFTILCFTASAQCSYSFLVLLILSVGNAQICQFWQLLALKSLGDVLQVSCAAFCGCQRQDLPTGESRMISVAQKKFHSVRQVVPIQIEELQFWKFTISHQVWDNWQIFIIQTNDTQAQFRKFPTVSQGWYQITLSSRAHDAPCHFQTLEWRHRCCSLGFSSTPKAIFSVFLCREALESSARHLGGDTGQVQFLWLRREWINFGF